jgi:hypothetical protein
MHSELSAIVRYRLDGRPDTMAGAVTFNWFLAPGSALQPSRLWMGSNGRSTVPIQRQQRCERDRVRILRPIPYSTASDR